MALSVAVFVGETIKWLPELVERARKLKVGPGHDATVDVGPLISPAALQRSESIIAAAVEGGAKLVLDGRKPTVPAGYEKGNFIGPTIIAGVDPRTSPAYKEEIFAPVLTVVSVDTLEDAIELTNSNPYVSVLRRFRPPFLYRPISYVSTPNPTIPTVTGMATAQQYLPAAVLSPASFSTKSMLVLLESTSQYLSRCHFSGETGIKNGKQSMRVFSPLPSSLNRATIPHIPTFIPTLAILTASLGPEARFEGT